MRVLLLAPFNFTNASAQWLFHSYSNVELTILGFEASTTTPLRWSFALIKQTIKAFSIYRRYEVVFSWGLANLLPLAFVHFFLHRNSPRFVGIDVAANRMRPGLTRILKVAVKPINAIICFTTAQKDWWTRSVGYPRAVFIHLGHLGHAYAFEAEDGDYIFSGGRIARDYQTLLRATAELSQRIILVVGNDPLTGKTGLEQTAPSKNVEIYCNIPEDRYLELMSRARLVVLTLQDTQYAAGQMVLLDALAMGKPVIVTKTVGTVDYVEDGKTGLLVEPGNVLQLKEKIVLLTNNPELRKTLGKNAKIIWQEKFTGNVLRQKITNVLLSREPLDQHATVIR